MTHVSWTGEPMGDQSVLVAAFEGWNDAGDAATGAVDLLVERWDAKPFAQIDPEEFFDFTATRPRVRGLGGPSRTIDWPTNAFSWATPPGSRGVVLLRGVEPQLRWRTFCTQVIDVATRTGCSMVITLGALLAEVAHTRPTPVFGNAYDQSVIDRLGLEPSHYEGPTGIVGVLHAECAAAGLDSASLWAAVPSYVPGVPSPKATLALTTRALELLGTSTDVSDLKVAAADYERQLSDLVAEDEATSDYVQELEDSHDRDAIAVQSADDMVSEVERFLREQ